MSSRPYQSKILTFVLRQIQQGRERHRRALRQVQSIATATAKGILFPVYTVVWLAQMAGRQLGQVIPKPWSFLGFGRHPEGAPELPTDLGKTLLDTVNSALTPQPVGATEDPSIQQVLINIQAGLLPAQRAMLQRQPGAIFPERGFANASELTAPFAGPTGSAMAAMPTLALSGVVQGIATDLENRTLVLVGPENQLWDILTDEQQHYLQQQISTLLTAYWRYRWQQLPLAQRILARLPLPKAWKQLWLPSLSDELLRFAPNFAPNFTPNVAVVPVTPGSLTVIQGIACDLETRAIVLVGAENHLWDILTDQQQNHLQQQIWALIAAYWRHQTRQLPWAQQLLARLPIPLTWQQRRFFSMLPEMLPSLICAQLTLVTPLAIERIACDLETGLMVLVGADNQLLDGLTLEQQLQLQHLWALIEAYWQYQSPGLGLGQRLWARLPSFNSWGVLPASLRQTAQILAIASASPGKVIAAADPKTSVGDKKILKEVDYWETVVTSFGYIEHPLEKLLRWVDEILSWIERKWAQLLLWLRLQP